MIDILDIKEGESYACKFKVECMLDVLGRPHPNLSDQPLQGPGVYEGLGIIMKRDTKSELVMLIHPNLSHAITIPQKDYIEVINLALKHFTKDENYEKCIKINTIKIDITSNAKILSDISLI